MGSTKSIKKRTTGDERLDELLAGGLPEQRVTVLAGGPGAGKTTLGLQVLVNAAEAGDQVLLVSLEERWKDLLHSTENMEFDLEGLRERGRLRFERIEVWEPATDHAAPASAVDLVVKRLTGFLEEVQPDVVLVDGLDPHLHPWCGPGGREAHQIVRMLRDADVTALMAMDVWDDKHRHPLVEAHVADCVIHLEMRFQPTIARYLSIRKYRGNRHSLDPFNIVIGRRGIRLPAFGVHEIPGRPSGSMSSSGIPALDKLLGGGVREGSVVYVGGALGTGKTSLAATAVDAACRRGERVLFVSFEKSIQALQQDFASIGIDLAGWKGEGLLTMRAVRPYMDGLEQYLLDLSELLDDADIDVAVLDPVTALECLGGRATAVVLKAIDMMRSRGITLWCTGAMQDGLSGDPLYVGVSPSLDVIVRLGHVGLPHEMVRALHVVNARGQRSSNSIQRFSIDDNGIHINGHHSEAGPEDLREKYGSSIRGSPFSTRSLDQ